MKIALTLLAFVAVSQARHFQIDLENNTAYNYLAKYGVPLAEKIRAAEAAGVQCKIVGGSLSTLGDIPYQAGLIATISRGRGVCGGSLLTVNRVLTAAHCWFDGVNQALNIEIVLGSITLFTGGIRRATSNVIMHKEWNPYSVRNDIAMIALPHSVFISANVKTISYATPDSGRFTGMTAVASGFGLTAEGGLINTQQQLSSVNLEVIMTIRCLVSFPQYIQSSNICTSGSGGASTCSGDSGGPLVIDDNGKPLLIGVYSFGSPHGCEQGYPAVFARVSSFEDFISANL